MTTHLLQNVLEKTTMQNIENRKNPILPRILSNINNFEPNLDGWISLLPSRYRDATLANCNELPKALVDFGERWAVNVKPKSLYIHGGYGSGKTWFSFALIHEHFRLREEKGYKFPKYHFWPNHVDANDLDSRLLKALKSEDGGAWEIEKWGLCDFLFIDDIDKVTISDRFKRQLFHIMNLRYEHEKTTIFTSNCIPDDLADLFDRAIVSRMEDPVSWIKIEFPDKDLRKSKKIIKL